MFKKDVISLYAKEHKKAFATFHKAIKKYDHIVVFRHIKPDFDALGSQMGLYTFLKDNFPNKDIHFVGDNHVTFTPRLFPETERLNDDYFSSPFLAIVLDVGDDERIADPRYKKADYIAKIDHHPFKKEISPNPIVDFKAASASELVVSSILNWKGTYLSKEAAKYFYIGIVGDSGRFLYSSTSAHTFAIAEELIKTGININEIYLAMYQKKLDDLKVTAYVLNHFEVSPHGVAYYCLSKEIQDKLEITPERGKENVNLFSNIEGINAWCSITEDPNPKDYCWRISIRSKEKDISRVANLFGGGGHKQASGAKIASLKELPAFIKALDDLFVK